GGLLGLSALYQIDRAYDPGAIYPSITYSHVRAELRDAGVPERKARTGRRLDLGDGVFVDVLAPRLLSLDETPAPVAYRIRVGRLAALMVNREAVADDPAPLVADGGCLDLLILPARADPAAAAALVRTLHPRLVILAPPTSRTSAATPRAADLEPLPHGTVVWQTAAGRELGLGAADGHC
ncbi:MAG TPA: hypothetical protein VHB98_12395, partial [Chloroflexota bacterium]|nr:hypothetical protein [Chloroflexota bacterium]